MLSFEDPEADYSFDILCFWATSDGYVYSASDSGCSCPKPFEDYEGDNFATIIPRLDRIGHISQAIEVFDAWNNQIRQYLEPSSSHREIREWFSRYGTEVQP